jgi:hypothetical protein
MKWWLKLIIFGIIIVILWGTIIILQVTPRLPESKTTVVQYVDRWHIVEKPVYIERVEYVEKPTELKPFESLHTLRLWAWANKVEPMGEDMCMYEAVEMQRRAFRDGYILNVELLREGDYKSHAVVTAYIDGSFWMYRIEPTSGLVFAFVKPIKPTGELWNQH